LVAAGEADLIISLEILETLRKLNYANKNTNFIINGYSIPFPGSLPDEQISRMVEENIAKRYIVPASRICQEKLEKEVLSGVYLLGYAVQNNLISLKKESVLKAIDELMPEKYREANKKAFELPMQTYAE